MLDAAVEAIRAGVNQYPPGPGMPVLREAIARHQQRFYGLAHDPDTEVLVTAGATEALAGALLGMLDDGDEVVVFEPMYDSYQACIALAGARAVPVLLRPGEDGQLPLRPRRAARRRVAADPAGAAQHAAQPDRQGVRRRRAGSRSPPLAIEHDLLVVTDEVYEHLVFPGATHVPIATLPGHGRAHADDLLGRQDVQHDRMEDRLDVRAGAARRRRPHGQAVPHLRQRGAVPAGDRRRARPRRRLLRRHRRRPDDQARPPRRRARAPPGSRRTCRRRRTSRPSTSAPVQPDGDGMAFCRSLPERCGVVAIPNEVFYARPEHGRHLVRFACCKRIDVLDEAAARLASLR